MRQQQSFPEKNQADLRELEQGNKADLEAFIQTSWTFFFGIIGPAEQAQVVDVFLAADITGRQALSTLLSRMASNERQSSIAIVSRAEDGSTVLDNLHCIARGDFHKNLSGCRNALVGSLISELADPWRTTNQGSSHGTCKTLQCSQI